MTTPVYVSPFTGTVVTPTDVSYYNLAFSTDQQLFWPSITNDTEVPAARIIDCTPSTSGLTIQLPAANQGTVGADILFRNLGSYPFIVTDDAGGQGVVVNAGSAIYVYLSDNSTVEGIWQNVTFGAGTSSADAATLQGQGLTVVSGKLATTQNVIQVSSDPGLTDANRASTVLWTGGVGTLALPAASTLSAGWYIGFRNAGTGTLTLTPQSPATIDGNTTVAVDPQFSGFIVFQQTTGTFFTIGLTAPQNITFTSAAYDVDAIPGNTFSLVSFAPVIQTYVSVSGLRTTSLAVTLPATTQIYVLSNQTNATGYTISFQLSGSSQQPLIVGNGEISTVLSDGNALYLLSQANSGTFYAVDGTAAAPSFSFNNDGSTGMYLDAIGILGLSANGVNLLTLDNTNVLAPVVSTTAQFNAGLIAGGQF